jgi:hypothetical protein
LAFNAKCEKGIFWWHKFYFVEDAMEIEHVFLAENDAEVFAQVALYDYGSQFKYWKGIIYPDNDISGMYFQVYEVKRSMKYLYRHMYASDLLEYCAQFIGKN